MSFYSRWACHMHRNSPFCVCECALKTPNHLGNEATTTTLALATNDKCMWPIVYSQLSAGKVCHLLLFYLFAGWLRVSVCVCAVFIGKKRENETRMCMVHVVYLEYSTCDESQCTWLCVCACSVLPVPYECGVCSTMFILLFYLLDIFFHAAVNVHCVCCCCVYFAFFFLLLPIASPSVYFYIK